MLAKPVPDQTALFNRYSLPLALCLVAAALLGSFSVKVEARGKLLADKSGSTAFLEIKTQDPVALADALVKVFTADGYDLRSQGRNQIAFARTASRMQELSYGTPLDPGSLESVTVDFFPISKKKYRVECNVTIISGAHESLSDAHILPLFGRQYKRMLRRVRRQLR